MRDARRAHAALGLVPIGWAAIHLWEQWAAFFGRTRWLERMQTTSTSAVAVGLEIALALAPIAAFLALDRRGAYDGIFGEDPEADRRLRRLARGGSWIACGWQLYHAAWLWVPKLLEGIEPLRAWIAMRAEMGAWPHVLANAIGLTAFGVHVWAATARAAIVFGVADAAPGRRAARWSGALLAVFFVVLYAQLAGWHAAGRGTIWPIDAIN